MRTIIRRRDTFLIAAAMAAAAVLCCGCADNGIGKAIERQKNANSDEPPSGAHVHDWGDWVVTTPATCEAAGVETRTCKLDASHKETQSIPKLTGASCNPGGGSSETVSLVGLKWMTKNLNVETEESWCYNNSSDSCAKYGRLYTWSAAKAACQSVGMRLPTRKEWDDLSDLAVTGQKWVSLSSDSDTMYTWPDAGTKLKSSTGWNSYSGISSTDDFQFSALPGGLRNNINGGFEDVGDKGYWWTATEYSDDGAYSRSMLYDDDDLYENDSGKSNGFSARCVQD